MFNEANRLCIAFHLGYAKLKNIQNNKISFKNGIVFDNNELIVGKYKKLHLSGHYNYRTFNKCINYKKKYLN